MKNYLKKQGYNCIDDGFYNLIDLWKDWYSGKVTSFHRYSQYNGKKHIRRERATLGAAKKVCEEWANLLFNEKVSIRTDSARFNKYLEDVFEKNNFKVRANRLIELIYALGTGAFVEYVDNGNVVIDYIRADMIYPLSWDNGEIIEVAFASEKNIGGKRCVYLNMHTLVDGGYKITNKLFEKKGYKMSEIALPEGIEAEIYTNSKIPLFQIITPNVVNNVDLDNPMGISVFANAIDILKGIDLIYDSYQNEFRLGKKRIIVPTGIAQFLEDESGVKPVFDDNDTEFYAFKETDSFTQIKEINMELRANEHEIALERNLNLLSSKCGLGNNRFTINANNMKTATEVISEKSELYQNLKKNEIIIKSAIVKLVRAIAYLSGFERKFDISIDFDDSVIQDSDAIAQRALSEYTNGIIDKVAYFEKVYNMTEQQAINEVFKIGCRVDN